MALILQWIVVPDWVNFILSNGNLVFSAAVLLHYHREIQHHLDREWLAAN